MTDPGAEFVVAFRVEVNGTAADAVDPIAPLDGFSACFGGHAGTVCAFSKEPDGVVKDAGVGVGCAADFFSGHGVSGEKAGHAGLVVEAGGALAQNALYAANIGDELFRTQDGREIFKPLEDAENGATKQDEVALLGGGDGVAGDFRNCFAAEGDGGLDYFTVPPEDGTGEAVLAQGHSDRAADESGTENGNPFDGHQAMLLPTADAMRRSSCMSLVNCSGKSVCAPSEKAFSGLGWTSMRRPSAPAAMAARAMAGTLSRRPTPCDGSPRTGRCESFLRTGMAEMSMVLRVYVSKVRMPRSQSMTS